MSRLSEAVQDVIGRLDTLGTQMEQRMESSTYFESVVVVQKEDLVAWIGDLRAAKQELEEGWDS